jgi:hypothetical protein
MVGWIEPAMWVWLTESRRRVDEARIRRPRRVPGAFWSLETCSDSTLRHASAQQCMQSQRARLLNESAAINNLASRVNDPAHRLRDTACGKPAAYVVGSGRVGRRGPVPAGFSCDRLLDHRAAKLETEACSARVDLPQQPEKHRSKWEVQSCLCTG